jgi:hypothetical protein
MGAKHLIRMPYPGDGVLSRPTYNNNKTTITSTTTTTTTTTSGYNNSDNNNTTTTHHIIQNTLRTMFFTKQNQMKMF